MNLLKVAFVLLCISLERLNRILFKPHQIIYMMYKIMSETFIVVIVISIYLT